MYVLYCMYTRSDGLHHFSVVGLFPVLFRFLPFPSSPRGGSAQREHGTARSRPRKGGDDQEDADPAGDNNNPILLP